MKQDIRNKIKAIEAVVDSGDYLARARSCDEWGGADAIISSQMNSGIQSWLGDDHLVISLQESTPRRRAVITPYSRELSWLFGQLGTAFSEVIDFS